MASPTRRAGLGLLLATARLSTRAGHDHQHCDGRRATGLAAMHAPSPGGGTGRQSCGRGRPTASLSAGTMTEPLTEQAPCAPPHASATATSDAAACSVPPYTSTAHLGPRDGLTGRPCSSRQPYVAQRCAHQNAAVASSLSSTCSRTVDTEEVASSQGSSDSTRRALSIQHTLHVSSGTELELRKSDHSDANWAVCECGARKLGTRDAKYPSFSGHSP